MAAGVRMFETDPDTFINVSFVQRITIYPIYDPQFNLTYAVDVGGMFRREGFSTKEEARAYAQVWIDRIDAVK